MPTKTNNMSNESIQVLPGGIQCDNPACDFTDHYVLAEDYKHWINKSCPKCGENLLTEKDYNDAIKLMKSIKLLNELLPPTDPDDTSATITAEVNVHNETINLKIV